LGSSRWRIAVHDGTAEMDKPAHSGGRRGMVNSVDVFDNRTTNASDTIEQNLATAQVRLQARCIGAVRKTTIEVKTRWPDQSVKRPHNGAYVGQIGEHQTLDELAADKSVSP
jgi:hypothetical protein